MSDPEEDPQRVPAEARARLVEFTTKSLAELDLGDGGQVLVPDDLAAIAEAVLLEDHPVLWLALRHRDERIKRWMLHVVDVISAIGAGKRPPRKPRPPHSRHTTPTWVQ